MFSNIFQIEEKKKLNHRTQPLPDYQNQDVCYLRTLNVPLFALLHQGKWGFFLIFARLPCARGFKMR